jgi:hypothetical protein
MYGKEVEPLCDEEWLVLSVDMIHESYGSPFDVTFGGMSMKCYCVNCEFIFWYISYFNICWFELAIARKAVVGR